MPLPSQFVRTRGTRRRSMYHARRRGPRKPAAIVALAVLAGGSYAGWRVLTPDTAGAGDDATTPSPVLVSRTAPPAARARPSQTSPAGLDRDQQEPEAPVTLTMGSPITVQHAPEPAPVPVQVDQPKLESPELQTEDLSRDVKQLVASAEEKRAAGELVGARELYLRGLYHPDTAEADRAGLRGHIASLNDEILFSPRFYPDEPLTRTYEVKGNDSLTRIARREGLMTSYELIARVNRMPDPNRLVLGKRLKLVTGPFHAEVVKSAFRMDIYSGPRDDPSRWRYVRSFRVGLGDDNATPVGEFAVTDSKVKNPSWTNPRTGETFKADNPDNPIGEYWLGLEGLGESSFYQGYGIHGTMDPDSIGKSRSMGCVRLLDEDAAFVYELLVPQRSRVRIVP